MSYIWLWWVLYRYFFFFKISWCKVFSCRFYWSYTGNLVFCIPNIETLRALDYRVLKIYVYTCYCSIFWTFSYCHVLDVLYSILYRTKYYYSHIMLLFPLGSSQMLFFYIFFYHRIHNGFSGQRNKIFDTDHNIHEFNHEIFAAKTRFNGWRNKSNKYRHIYLLIL